MNSTLSTVKLFFVKNKVFFIGLISSITLVLQQYASAPAGSSINWPTLGYAAFIAILGYVANQWRGAGVTITGIIGTVAGIIAQSMQSHQPINASQLIIFVLLAIGGAVAPPPKTQGYEQSAVITAAKDSPTK